MFQNISNHYKKSGKIAKRKENLMSKNVAHIALSLSHACQLNYMKDKERARESEREQLCARLYMTKCFLCTCIYVIYNINKIYIIYIHICISANLDVFCVYIYTKENNVLWCVCVGVRVRV